MVLDILLNFLLIFACVLAWKRVRIAPLHKRTGGYVVIAVVVPYLLTLFLLYILMLIFNLDDGGMLALVFSPFIYFVILVAVITAIMIHIGKSKRTADYQVVASPNGTKAVSTNRAFFKVMAITGGIFLLLYLFDRIQVIFYIHDKFGTLSVIKVLEILIPGI